MSLDVQQRAGKSPTGGLAIKILSVAVSAGCVWQALGGREGGE